MLSFRVSESAGLACNAKQHLRDLSTGSQAIKWLYNRDSVTHCKSFRVSRSDMVPLQGAM